MKKKKFEIEGVQKGYTVATGNLDLTKKASRQAVKYVSSLDGLVLAFDCYPHGMLWVFDTLNNAKGARNLMNSKGIKTGNNICEVTYDKQGVIDTKPM